MRWPTLVSAPRRVRTCSGPARNLTGNSVSECWQIVIGELLGLVDAWRAPVGVMSTARLLSSHAVEAQCRPSPSHTARPLPRHQLASLLGRTEATWRPHAMAGRGGCCGLVGGHAKHARWTADLLRPGDRTRADAAPRLPLGPAPGRGVCRQHSAPARARSVCSGPFLAQPAGTGVLPVGVRGCCRVPADPPCVGQQGLELFG